MVLINLEQKKIQTKLFYSQIWSTYIYLVLSRQEQTENIKDLHFMHEL